MNRASSAAPDALASCVAELVARASVEMSPHRVADARTLAELLPPESRVYVAHVPGLALPGSLAALQALRAAGLDPVPHVAARRVSSREELRDFLTRAVRDAGVRRVMLIGGDEPEPAGPYADSVAPLAEGALAEFGVREVGIAGYPDGHPRIAPAALERALEAKLAAAAAQGLGVYAVTQFSFAPKRVVKYCAELATRRPRLPVHVGIAGPTDAATLLRYAKRCGVRASLRALRTQGLGLARLAAHSDPGEQLAVVAHYRVERPDCNLAGVHFFSFGGAEQTARWMSAARGAAR